MTSLLRSHGDTVARAGELDFAVNVWPERDPRLARAIRGALDDPRYPSDRAAREAVAARHGRDPDEVLLLNGACEGFWLLAHALRPARAACVHPSFTEPEAALRAVGAEVVHVLRDPETWALPDVAEDVVVVGNPNNPTGNLDDVTPLLRPGRLVVVDESFMDFVPGERHSVASLRAPGLVVVRSLTKLWSLAGLRAGYLLAEPELVARLEAQRQPWSVNAGALAALAWCARDRDTPARIAAEVAAAREQLRGALPFRTWPSAANFLLVEGRLDAPGFALRSCDSFPGLEAGFTRIAVRRPAENALLVEALCR